LGQHIINQTSASINGNGVVAACTKSNTTITGLTSGQQYWFQVAALATAGQGPWSDRATKMVS